MGSETANIGLYKYSLTDKFSITAEENSLNHNMDLIDQAIGEINAEKVTNENLNNAVAAALEEAKNSGEFKGDPGIQGPKGSDGKDGISVTHSWENTTLSITSASGTSSVDLKGDKGDTGEQGIQGPKGDKGEQGANGITPVKGTDYFTSADKTELVDQLVKKTGIDVLPNYVIEEAESVIERIIAAQGTRTFTFAAISDLHYGNGSYTDGVLHATQALKYIDKRIKLDAVAVLGDYTDGYPIEGLSNALNDFKTVNSILNELRFAPNLRQQGNHDYYKDNFPITHRFIQAYSDDVVWGEKLGGYYYKDFEDYKLRVISLNTVEDNNSNLDCSAKQYEWFVESLDLSKKDDMKDWQILILSHHPLDWYTNDAGSEGWYRLPKILYGYQNKLKSATASGYGSNFTPAFDFSVGNAGAKIIANIHGHIHNLLTAKIYLNLGNTSVGDIGIWRMATPEACINRANQYDGVWKEDATYGKIKDTKEDTSFVVYCIDLDTNVINAICYGAGRDRYLDYKNNTQLNNYTITNTLVNFTNSNDALTITEGESYSAILTPTIVGDETNIVITMGGTDITSSVYTSSTGAILINSVTGNIVITASTIVVENTDPNNLIPQSINADGSSFIGSNGEDGYISGFRLSSTGTLKEATNHSVTGFIPVISGDTIIFKNIKYKLGQANNYIAFYKYENNTMTHIYSCNSESFTNYYYIFFDCETDENNYLTKFTLGDNAGYTHMRVSALNLDNTSVITKNKSENTTYTITNNLSNVTTNNNNTNIEAGQSYNATLSWTGDTAPTVSITMDGTDITSEVYSNGVITITNVTGNIVITATIPEDNPISYTNQIPLSTDTDGIIYNGQGWKTNTRLNSDGVTKDVTDMETTGFIPVEKDNIIYFKNLTYIANANFPNGEANPYKDYEYLAFYDANKQKLVSANISVLANSLYGDGKYSGVIERKTEDYNLTMLNLTKLQEWTYEINPYKDMNFDNMAYFRISAQHIDNNSIITINQSLE